MKTKTVSVNDSPVIMFVNGQITHSVSIPKNIKAFTVYFNLKRTLW